MPSSVRSPSACFTASLIEGVSAERLASLRAQRHAQAAKVVTVYDRSVWPDLGANGLSEGELFSPRPGRSATVCSRGSFRPSGCLARRDRRGASARRRCTRSSSACTAPRPRARAHVPPALGHRPVHARLHDAVVARGRACVGPLHGTHEPPFYVCGSDQWVAGYMEGAVRTGRGAAAAALRSEAWTPA